MLTRILLEYEPWSALLTRLGALGQASKQGALDVLVAIVIMFMGWGVAALLAQVLRAVLRVIRFDDGFRRAFGAGATSRNKPTGIAAWLVYWVVMAAASMLALEVLGLSLATPVAARLGEVIPRIVTAAVLFAIGSLIAVLIGSIARRFLESAEIRAARLQGQAVTAVLTGFSALLGLEQLGFAAQFVMAIGVVAVAAAGAGLALAFGLGCRDLARDFLVEYLRSLDDEGPKRPG